MDALLGLLGVAGLGVAIIMLIVKAVFKKGWQYKNIGILAGVALVLLVIGLSVSPSTKGDHDADYSAARQTGEQVEQVEQREGVVLEKEEAGKGAEKQPKNLGLQEGQPEWNAQDIDVETNGNMPIAIALLSSDGDIKSKAEDADPSSVMKKPWEYYGKIIKFTGVVGIVQEYPPGSDISEAAGSDNVGELVIATEDMVFIDYLHIGSTGTTNVGDTVTVYGYPVGIVEVVNKLGGTTQQLFVVGNIIENH